MRKNILFLVLATLIGIVTISYGALAFPVNGTDFTLGQQASSWQGDSATSISAEGGNLTALNIKQNTQSSNWQVFYGNVSKKLTLKASSGVSVYDWGTSSLASNDGYVIFSDSNSIDWSTIAACSAVHCQYQEDAALGLTGIDNVTATFAGVGNHKAISLASSSIVADAAPTVSTNGTAGVKWNEALLYDTSTSNSTLYLAFINQSHNSFYGNSADYQVMIPTNSSDGLRTSYVYAAIN